MAVIGASAGATTTQRTSFGYGVSSGANDAELEARDISSMLDVLHPNHAPLLTMIGRDSLRDSATQVKHEWLEETIRGLSTTTTDTDLNNTSTGVVVLTVSTAEGFKFRGSTNDYDGPSDVVRISSTAGSELARCTASTTTTVSVDRGYASWSTPVDHTGYTKTITIIGTMQSQGLTTVGASRTTTKDLRYNYTQIFETSLRASKTFQSTRKHLSGNELDRQRAYELELMAVQFERTLLFGKRQAPADQDPSAMDGIRAVLSTNVYDKSSAALTQAMLEDALEACWNAGAGNKGLDLVANTTQLRRIDTFLDTYRQAAYTDSALGNYVTTYRTRWADVTLVADRNMPADEILILDRNLIGFGPLQGRALAESRIEPTSREADLWQWTGEYTSETRLEKSHARLYNLATTGLF